ncbi:hypothetical protein ACR71G_11130 [Xenorhabdus bovienii]|uniref:hypothetical protein n=1 Tax=Xenorhabdus bovienii TaxID=40576 RepID=UPI003DA40F1E
MKYLVGLVMILFSVTVFSKQNELDFKSWENTGKWGVYYKKPDSHFNPLKIKKYKDNYLPAFNYVIKVFETQNVNNEFCLIGYKFNKSSYCDGFERVIIFWKTANYFINWEVPDGDYDDKYKSIIFSTPFVDISKSVVPYKEAEGAQALWAKEGVIQMMNDCELNGQKITITPSGVR